MPALSGHGGWVKIVGPPGALLRAHQWVVRVSAQEHDVTTTLEAGGRMVVTRLPRCEVMLDAFWDFRDNPFSQFNLTAGSVTGPLIFGLRSQFIPGFQQLLGQFQLLNVKQTLALPVWTFPGVRWLQVEMKASVRDVIRYHLLGVVTDPEPDVPAVRANQFTYP